MAYLRPFVTGINDAILSRLCLKWERIRDQGLRRDTSSCSPPGNVSLGIWTGMTSRGWRLSSHKGQWHLTTGASHAAA
jgi:hypothetical protein